MSVYGVYGLQWPEELEVGRRLSELPFMGLDLGQGLGAKISDIR